MKSHEDAEEDQERHRAAQPLSLRANFKWTFAGNVIYAACQWAMIVALAKLGTPDMVGQFALGLAITAPIILFANLNLRFVQATDVRHTYQFGHYLGLRLVALAGAVLLIAGVVSASGYSAEASLIIALIALWKVFDSLSDVVYGLLQQHEQMHRIAISRMAQGLLQMAAMWTTLTVTGSLAMACLSLMAASALVTVCYDLRSAALAVSGVSSGSGVRRSRIRPRWQLAVLWKIAVLALPLGIAGTFDSLTANIPRYFVEWHLGEAALGHFAATAYSMMAGNTLSGALADAMRPRLAQHFICDKDRFLRLLIKATIIGGAIGLAGIVLALVSGRWLLSVLYRAEYAANSDLLVWMMIAATLWYVAGFLSAGLTAARNFRVQTWIFAAAAAAILLSSVSLIPERGLVGAAWSFCIGMVVRVALSVLFLNITLRHDLGRGHLAAPEVPVEPHGGATAIKVVNHGSGF